MGDPKNQFLNYGDNNVMNNTQVTIKSGIKQTDEICFYIDKKTKCKTPFQEKCNFCQFMFCKKHLYVQDRYFLCDNCISILRVHHEVNTNYRKCILCCNYGAFCFCLGPILYCLTAPFCVKKWSEDSHIKHRKESRSQADCTGFGLFCNCFKVKCSGHGIDLTKEEEEEIIKQTNQKEEEKEIEDLKKELKKAELLKSIANSTVVKENNTNNNAQNTSKSNKLDTEQLKALLANNNSNRDYNIGNNNLIMGNENLVTNFGDQNEYRNKKVEKPQED